MSSNACVRRVEQTDLDGLAGEGREVGVVVLPAVGRTGEAVLLVAEVGHPAVGVGVAVRGGHRGARLVEDLLLGPRGATVGRDLDEAEVPVLLDVEVVPHPEAGVRGAGRHRDVTGQGVLRPRLVGAGVPHVRAGVRLGEGQGLGRQVDLDAVSGALGGAARLAHVDRARVVTGVDLHRVGPAQDPLVPDAHVGRHRLEDGAGVRAGAHQVPAIKCYIFL